MKKTYSNIAKGFAVLVAAGFLFAGCEKDEFEPIDSDSAHATSKADWLNDGADDGDLNDPVNPAGNDTVKFIPWLENEAVTPVPGRDLPGNWFKDDRVRDGSDNEEEDDGEDNGGRQSSLTES